MTDINTTRTPTGQPGGTRSAESVMQMYRRQEKRLTRRLRWAVVVIVAGFAFIAFAISDGVGTVHAMTAIAASLTLVAAAGRIRQSRNRLRQLLRSGEAEKIAHRVAEAAGNPQQVGPPPLFSQQYCRVSRTTARGRAQAQPGQVPPVYLVTVRPGWLTVTETPATPVMRVPATEVQMLAPRRQYFGSCTAIRFHGQTWVVDFTGVYFAERGIGFLRQTLTFGSPRRTYRRGREINDRFVSALLAAGTTQQGR